MPQSGNFRPVSRNTICANIMFSQMCIIYIYILYCIWIYMWYTHTHILYVNYLDHFCNQISGYSEPLLRQKAISSGWPTIVLNLKCQFIWGWFSKTTYFQYLLVSVLAWGCVLIMQPLCLVPSGTICCCVSGLAGLPQSSRSTWRFDHPCSSHVSYWLWRFHETRAAHNVAREVRWKTTKSCNIRNNCNTAIYDNWNSPVVLYHIPVVCLYGKIHHHKEILDFSRSTPPNPSVKGTSSSK